MMSALSNYLENALLDHILNNVSYTSPAAVYVALFLTDPTDADVGTEVSGGSYARQTSTFTITTGTAENSGTITFPMATADWGVVKYAGIYDSLSGGNLLLHTELTSWVTVLNGDTLSFLAGELRVTLE